MFIHNKDRIGTMYLEFQFCKINNPVRFNKVKNNIIKHWENDSLLLNDDNAEKFFKSYIDIFNCALHPNGTNGYDSFGVNYYDKDATQRILLKLKDVIKEEFKELIPWLEEAITKYNGFYILGV